MVRLLVRKKCNIIFIMYKSEIYFLQANTEVTSEPVTEDPKHELYYK